MKRTDAPADVAQIGEQEISSVEHKISKAILAAIFVLTFLSPSYSQVEETEHDPIQPTCKAGKTSEQTLSGQTLTAAGKPAAKVKVFLEDEGGKARVAVSNSIGCFAFKGVIPYAVYHVYIESDVYSFKASVRSFLPGDHLVIRERERR